MLKLKIEFKFLIWKIKIKKNKKNSRQKNKKNLVKKPSKNKAYNQ